MLAIVMLYSVSVIFSAVDLVQSASSNHRLFNQCTAMSVLYQPHPQHSTDELLQSRELMTTFAMVSSSYFLQGVMIMGWRVSAWKVEGYPQKGLLKFITPKLYIRVRRERVQGSAPGAM